MRKVISSEIESIQYGWSRSVDSYYGSIGIVLCVYAYYQILNLPISRESILSSGHKKRGMGGDTTEADAVDHELSSMEVMFQPFVRSISTTFPSLAAHY